MAVNQVHNKRLRFLGLLLIWTVTGQGVFVFGQGGGESSESSEWSESSESGEWSESSESSESGEWSERS